jgi:membrane protease YdiL (CAAX protease family)
MSAEVGKSTTPIVLPLWQLMLVVVGLPAMYLLNSMLPWSAGLIKARDHDFFWQFWASIAVLHWSSFALVCLLLRRARRRLSDIGLKFSRFRVAVMVGIPAVVALGLLVLHQGSNPESGLPSNPQLPATMAERLFWIFISFTAGFCEEVVYRGFCIRVLQGRNIRTWLAVGIATLAFFFMHAPSVVIGDWKVTLTAFLIIYGLGLLFSVLFLWRRSLVPGICLHTLIDLAN